MRSGPLLKIVTFVPGMEPPFDNLNLCANLQSPDCHSDRRDGALCRPGVEESLLYFPFQAKNSYVKAPPDILLPWEIQPAPKRNAVSPWRRNRDHQYRATLGSTSVDQDNMPPRKFCTLRNPALRRKSTASAERFPLRQCATISCEESSSCTRRGNSPSGIRCPFKLQIWYSCGSRTSRINNSSPRSIRTFSSCGVISGTCRSSSGSSSPRMPQNSL